MTRHSGSEIHNVPFMGFRIRNLKDGELGQSG